MENYVQKLLKEMKISNMEALRFYNRYMLERSYIIIFMKQII